ncbi:MAG: saccharopine dehydrogenase NADP-binding domain-containing protein [Anaerolineales bacterium]
MKPWMIYGAYGYTGALMVEVAMQRGHSPVLAGRSEEKLRPLAERYNLPYRVAALDDPDALSKALEGMAAVCHAAGPYVHTAAPMVQACLQAGVHYLDITGEIAVFERHFRLDEAARQAGITLLSGVGFDVVPSDCLAAYVAAQMPDATHLELAFTALSGASAGTTKSMLEGLPRGSVRRVDGRLVPARLGRPTRMVRFKDRERLVAAIPWGDLSTAYRTTGIPNITTYMAYPRRMIRWMPLIAAAGGTLLRLPSLRRAAQRWAETNVHGPDENVRQTKRAHLWAEVRNAAGQSIEARLEVIEPYQFTAEAALRATEAVLQSAPVGAQTPALAFGAEFVLQVPRCAFQA